MKAVLEAGVVVSSPFGGVGVGVWVVRALVCGVGCVGVGYGGEGC